VDRILDAIVLGPWVAGYATGEGIVERLDGLRGRLGFTPLPAADRAAIAPELDALSGRADDALGAILAW
jgi:hypothetical protein